MENDNLELKRCPFCGSGNVKLEDVVDNLGDHHYRVVCQYCEIQTAFDFSKEYAIDTWNNRFQEKNNQTKQ